MHAVILAGGKGTRLRPLTLDLPKPVVPLLNRPLLEYQLAMLAAAGFGRATLSTSYQPDRIREVMGDRSAGLDLGYAVEPEPLGTGGAVRFAASPADGTVVVFNGDILSDLDLSAVLEFHRRKGAGVTIVLSEVEDPTNYGLVVTGADGRVRQFLEKPGWDETDGLRTINAGTYVIEPEYLSLIKEGVHLSIEREFFPLLVERGDPFYAYVHRGYWIDIGTVGKYLKAHADLLRLRPLTLPGHREVLPGIHAAEDAVVAAGVEARGPVVVGRGARVGEGVVFSRFCVLGPGCTIGDGAHLDACVLWDGVRVGEGARLQGVVAGQESRLGSHTRISGLFALGTGGHLPDYSHHAEMGEILEGE
jgi:NDP-sugar pyrophosphorylase family protein